jgi:pilus assembly protein CpaB
MDRKKMMLLVAALIVAIGTALLARSMFAGAGAPSADAAAAAAAKGPKVLVAQRALPAGTIITADSVSYQAWPKDMVQDAYFINGEADVTKLLGTVVRFPGTAGEPITQGSLVAPGDRGFLAAALGPGMRAVTVPVSAKTGVAGFVFPGDHIDLILTQTVKPQEGEPLRASETVLRNLRVLATDQSTEKETVEGKTVVRTSKTVTLEVTPKIAEKIAVAQTIGTLSLSLRAIADNQGELERAIAAGDVSIPEGASKQEEERLLKAAMSRPIDGTSTFVTGGDVSRFQRRSMPASKEQLAREFMRSAGQAAGNAAVGAVAQGNGPISIGPVVRVSRGKVTEAVSVGGK